MMVITEDSVCYDCVYNFMGEKCIFVLLGTDEFCNKCPEKDTCLFRNPQCKQE